MTAQVVIVFWMQAAIALKETNRVRIESRQDFITNLRSSPDGSLAATHELNFVELISSQGSSANAKIQLQSNVYDAAFVGGSKVIVSNNHMPVRVFEAGEKDVPAITFYDRKPNSELFLAPLQFASQGDQIVGAGKKFMSCYDCQKGKALRVKEMDKKYISSVELLGDSVVTGQFDGQVQVVDLKSGEVVQSIKPHMDLVTRVQRVERRDHCFVTLARKDNLCYFWDMRNMERFVKCFQHPRHGNQRTGLATSGDGNWLFLGGEKGEIFIHCLQEQIKEQTTFDTGTGKCVSALSLAQQTLFSGVGERQFLLEEESAQGQSGNFLLSLGLVNASDS